MDAREFAIKAHGDQKYGTEPYVVHLDGVVGVLKEFGYTDDETLAAAYLHDVLEDTKTEFSTLLGIFGSAVARAVLFATDELGPNRRLRKRDTYAAVIRDIAAWEERDERAPLSDEEWDAVPIGMRVKLADRIANIRSTLQDRGSLFHMYRKERKTFYLAYHSVGVCDAMWAEYDRLLES